VTISYSRFRVLHGVVFVSLDLKIVASVLGCTFLGLGF
jgi:hypothetical protein